MRKPKPKVIKTIIISFTDNDLVQLKVKGYNSNSFSEIYGDCMFAMQRHMIGCCTDFLDKHKEQIIKVWEEQLGNGGRGLITEDEFFTVSSPESIRRCRQQLQQFFVDIRGTSYDDRHKKREPAIRKEVQDEKWNEIENINAERLLKHSIAFQYVYDNKKISPENKKVLLEDIAKMEKGESLPFKSSFPFDSNSQLISTICDWDSTGHWDIWAKASKEE